MPFRIALSGLAAASADLKVTGNNIANAATTGFKQSRAEFADVYAVAFGGTAKSQTGAGVRVANIAQQFTQGSIEFSNRALDLAVNGGGFFVVSEGQNQVFTRDGNFHVDNSGTVVNNYNQPLKVFPVNGNGNISGQVSFNTGSLSNLQLTTTDGTPNPTSTVSAGLNLNASAVVPTGADPSGNGSLFDPNDPTTYTSATSTIVYDSLGAEHTAAMYYEKTPTANTWNVFTVVDGYTAQQSNVSPVSITFDANGRLITPASGAINYDPITSADLGISNNIAPLQLNVDYSNTTQFGTPFGVNSLSQDGFTSGRLTGVDVDPEGIVYARFTNGQSSALGKVALANFANPQGLRQMGDTQWSQTLESGSLVLGEAGTGSFGLLQSGALEASNVDIATSLVGLITAQRNFQANAQVISTADTITQTIINI